MNPCIDADLVAAPTAAAQRAGWFVGKDEELSRRVLAFVAEHRRELVSAAHGATDLPALVAVVQRQIRRVQSLDHRAEARDERALIQPYVAARLAAGERDATHAKEEWIRRYAGPWRRRLVRAYVRVAANLGREITDVIALAASRDGSPSQAAAKPHPHIVTR